MSPNERKPGESFEQYKVRRTNQNYEDKQKAKGRLIWNSSRNGMYCRRIHGDI